MNGYIIEVTNKLTNKVEYVKNYVIEIDNVSIDLTDDINNAYIIKDDSLSGVLSNCLLSAIDLQYADNVSKRIINVERETKVTKND